jgi:transcriptional regulator with XRE-family HTH domain
MSLEWTLGNRIEKARNKAGLKQAELALRIGVSRQLISKWERDVSEPTVSQLIDIAKTCSVGVLALLDLDPSMTCLTWPSDLAAQLELEFDARRPDLALAASATSR